MSVNLLDLLDSSDQSEDSNLKMTTVEEMQNKVNFLKDELAKREALMKTLSVRRYPNLIKTSLTRIYFKLK